MILNEKEKVDKLPAVGTAMVPRSAPSLTISTLSRLLDDCLPTQIEHERDMQELIDKLWPALVCELEL